MRGLHKVACLLQRHALNLYRFLDDRRAQGVLSSFTQHFPTCITRIHPWSDCEGRLVDMRLYDRGT
jgi:hypothetical protein